MLKTIIKQLLKKTFINYDELFYIFLVYCITLNTCWTTTKLRSSYKI